MASLSELTFPLAIAHRGFRSCFPENSLSAFAGALEWGAQMVELDVGLSADGRLMVLHDEGLYRTTGAKGLLSQWSFDQLRRLDCGSWFSPLYKGEVIPTLAEVLRLTKGRCAVNIEIKPQAHRPEALHDGVEAQVLSLVRQMGMEQEVLISSFSPAVLRYVRRLHRGIPLGVLSERGLDQALRELILSLQAYSWNPPWKKLRSNQVKWAQEQGVKVFPYTLANFRQAEVLLVKGVDGFFLDDPF